MSVGDLETRLSGARLKLLDKKKQVREAVHEHYLDLVAVSDHAVRITENADSLVNAYSRIPLLCRSLRLKGATAQLSSPAEVADDSVGLQSHESTEDRDLESLLSFKAKILFLANGIDFQEILKQMSDELPHLKELSRQYLKHELVDASRPVDGLESLIVSGCWRAISSPRLDTTTQFVACLKLLQRFVPEGVQGEFWQRRAALVINSQEILDQMRVFEITLCAANISGIGISEEFLGQFGSTNGLIASNLMKSLGDCTLPKIFDRYVDMREAMEDFRKSANIVRGQFDIFETVDHVIKQLVEKAVISSLENLAIETLRMDALRTCLTGLVSEISRFNTIFSLSEAETVVGRILDDKLFAVSVESDRNQLGCGIRASEMLHSLKQGGEFFNLSVSRSIERLEDLERDTFDMYFDNVCADLSKEQTAAGFELCADPALVPSVFNYGRAVEKDVLVPTHLSPYAFHVCFGLVVKLIDLPIPSWTSAISSMKTSLTRLFISRISSQASPRTMQALFDVACVMFLCSALKESPDYEYFVSNAYEKFQSEVLVDQVDLILYRDLIKTSAFIAVAHRNCHIFQPFLLQNPLVSHYASRGIDPASITAGSILDSLAGKGQSQLDRFPTLPVAKTVLAAPGKPAAPQPAATRRQTSAPANSMANSVTSFFNQVGKITLGGKQ